MARPRGLRGSAPSDAFTFWLWGFCPVAALAILSVAAPLGATLYGMQVAIALGVAFLQAVAIPLAIARPLPALVLALVGVVAAMFTAPGPSIPWPVSVTSIIAFPLALGVAALRLAWKTPSAMGSVAVLAAVVMAVVAPPPGAGSGPLVADVVVFTAVSAIAVAVAVLVRNWREVGAQLARERQVSAAELARREVAEERTRIARELHDVVAHGMSAIQVQAASARYRLPGLDESAAAEFDDLAATSRSAMTEMRRLLDVLREEGVGAEDAPQPGLAEIPALVDRAVTGGRITLVDRIPDDSAAALDPVEGLSVFRVVQESLSNAARHAPGASVRILLERVGADLVAVVENSLPTGPPPRPADPGGHGIKGMRERASLLGGDLEADTTSEGGFCVRARMPIEAWGRR